MFQEKCCETFWDFRDMRSSPKEEPPPSLSLSFFFSEKMGFLRTELRIFGSASDSDRNVAFGGEKLIVGVETIGGGPRVWATGRDRSASGVRALGCRHREASAARRPASIVEARGPLRPSNPYNPVSRIAPPCTYAYVVTRKRVRGILSRNDVLRPTPIPV